MNKSIVIKIGLGKTTHRAYCVEGQKRIDSICGASDQTRAVHSFKTLKITILPDNTEITCQRCLRMINNK